MTVPATRSVLAEAALLRAEETPLLRQTFLLALGVVALIVAAKLRVPFWPVPMTMQTFAVLAIGAAYGARLGGLTLLAYLAIGALGFDVFTSSSAENAGLAYMAGPTGGYLLGFLLASIAIGVLARRGWDRRPVLMAGAMLVGQVLIFAPGLLWLGHLFAEANGWAWVLNVGLVNFLPAEVLKLALAILVFPALWRLAQSAH
ncbi:MAG: biotin transporter BioY [Pseudomonadota bacterium]